MLIENPPHCPRCDAELSQRWYCRECYSTYAPALQPESRYTLLGFALSVLAGIAFFWTIVSLWSMSR